MGCGNVVPLFFYSCEKMMLYAPIQNIPSMLSGWHAGHEKSGTFLSWQEFVCRNSSILLSVWLLSDNPIGKVFAFLCLEMLSHMQHLQHAALDKLNPDAFSSLMRFIYADEHDWPKQPARDFPRQTLARFWFAVKKLIGIWSDPNAGNELKMLCVMACRWLFFFLL